MAEGDTKRFRIAFSFAGEKRPFVAAVADILAQQFGKARILYDKYHEAEFARDRLGIYLPKLYAEQSDLVVLVLCSDYDQTLWTGCEWTHIYGLLTKSDRHRVMPCRFDKASPDGLSPAAGFIELDEKTPAELAILIKERLAINEGMPRNHYTDFQQVMASPTGPDLHDKVDSPDSEAAIRILLLQLHPTLLHNDKLTEQLFDGAVDNISDDLIAPLMAAVGALKRKQRKVEAISAFSPAVARPIANREDFVAALLADFVLQHPGHLKWFIQKTSAVVQKEKAFRDVAERIWRELAERYLNEQSEEFRLGLQEVLHREIRDALRDKPNRLSPFFQFLWPTLSKFPKVIEGLIDFLQNLRAELGDANPNLLTSLLVLQGQGERFIKSSSSTRFQPDLVEIAPGGYCDYLFEAMRTPLTNREHTFLCGTAEVEDRRLYEPHLLGPWNWQTGSGQEHRYPQVAAELRAILESCEHTAHKPGYSWRIPTVAEWLRLACCENQSHPWGETEPTADRANLRFRGTSRRVRPVGSYPKGRSAFGAEDCCGNIHELAWASYRERLPDDSRLMGGCYLTRPEQSSCRHVRLLSRREPDPRRNVGLRLVRVPDNSDRWSSLLNVVKALEVDTDND